VSDTLYKLLAAIEQADRDKVAGFDTLASADWDEIIRLCEKMREEMSR